jgi:hypothetical protein
VFENRVMMKTFGLKRAEETGGWRKLHNEELLDLYSSPSIIRIIKSTRRVRWARHIARIGEKCIQILSKMDLRETGWSGVVMKPRVREMLATSREAFSSS